jgi:DNA ligase-1
MKPLNTLYKQTSTGAIQRWRISVKGNAVITEYGLLDGKQQVVTDIVKEGLNLGKSNATTPETQAQLQAKQEWDAKIKKGYVEDINLAESKKNNLAAIEPMLAFPIDKKEKHVIFPAYAQPKLDGLRCIAIIKNGKAKLFSRTQKPIDTMPHIVADLEKMYEGRDIIIDGELYSHEFKNDFNTITHIAKRDDVHDDHKKIEYHQYDRVAPGGYKDRAMDTLVDGDYCHIVKTVMVMDRDGLEDFQAECIAQGYEGCMYRNPSGPYEHKRSSYLLKVKTFQDDEFKIVGAEEGSGKLMGAIGAFVLVTAKGVGFKAKPACTLEQSVAYWKNRQSYVGKMATVKYQALTPDGIPRFPVFKAVREE